MHIENFKAENEYVIVEHIKEKTLKMESGILIMEKAKWADVMSGTIKVSSESVKLPSDVTVGTKVFFFEKDVKSRFHLDSKEYLTIKDMDLLAYE